MSSSFSLPAQIQTNVCLASAADAAGRTGTYVSLKGAHKAWIYCFVNQGHATPPSFTPKQATAVAGTSAKVISAVPIIANQDTSAATVAQSSAANFTTSATLKNKLVIFEIDPSALDVNGGFDCISVTTGASDALNLTSALIFLQTRYASVTTSTAFTD